MAKGLEAASITVSDFINQPIQSVPGGKVNILGGHSIGTKNVYMKMCSIPNGFRYLASSILIFACNIFLSSRRNDPLSEACESV
jgi:hypothetical protein